MTPPCPKINEADRLGERERQFRADTENAIRHWPKSKLGDMARQYEVAARRALEDMRGIDDPKLAFMFQAQVARHASRAHAFRIAAGGAQ